MDFQVEKIDIKKMKEKYDTILQNTDEDDAYNEAMVLLQQLIDTVKTIPIILDDWSAKADELGWSYDGVPPIILDYIDECIGEGEVGEDTMANDIIAMFETGSLKGLVNADGEIDKKLLEGFTKKRTKELKKKRVQATKMQPSVEPDDSVF